MHVFRANKSSSALVQVYQVISGGTATLDNVVEFYVRYSLPRLPGLPEAEPAVATLRLRHSLEILSNSTVQITFEDTEVKTTGDWPMHNLLQAPPMLIGAQHSMLVVGPLHSKPQVSACRRYALNRLSCCMHFSRIYVFYVYMHLQSRKDRPYIRSS